MRTLQEDKHIMTLLGVSELSRVIAHTNKGYLTLLLRKNEDKYHLILDSVPLDKETNKELMEMLFPKKELEIPQVNKDMLFPKEPYFKGEPMKIPLNIKPKLGRPKGAKSGVSTME